ncbi:Protein mothers against dpp [Thelohanellus kitauei]|uniref:Mothers against decapentaplegic homolog n=1 Tax=Thelohanellus kitauei TaxID=669202 RepID=A0A0C2J427_THEKT|nr:Protein mothers against dpp [Thelohanellus kitauei]
MSNNLHHGSQHEDGGPLIPDPLDLGSIHPLSVQSDGIFNYKAIESLVKKLKDNTGDLENLLSVVTGRDQNSPCICIQRTLDGRLQINGRKGFPHVIFARIWRYPFLRKNQLSAVPNCKYSHESKSELICVNPYHYNILDPASVSTNEFSTTYQNPDCLPLGDKSNINPTPFGVGTTPSIPPTTFPPMGLMPLVSTAEINFGPPPGVTGLPPGTIPGLNSAINLPTCMLLCLFIVSSPPYIPNEMSHPIPVPLPMFVEGSVKDTEEERGNHDALRFWCTVSYHEFNLSVGEVYRVPRECKSFIVDGYFNTDNQSSRYSLGQFTNIHRNSLVERTRMYIGPGIEVSLNENEIYLHCRSLESVFVESGYLDSLSNNENKPFVHKIYHNAVVKILDLVECYHKMAELVEKATSNRESENGNPKIDVRSIFTKISTITRIRLAKFMIQIKFRKRMGS